MSALKERFQEQAERQVAIIQKFKNDLDADPAYRLSWGTDVFAAAAKLRVLKRLINVLGDAEATEDDVHSLLMANILHKSQYPAESSSPTSNLIEQYELAACSEIINDLPRYHLDFKVRTRVPS
jgi:hypothetical protein